MRVVYCGWLPEYTEGDDVRLAVGGDRVASFGQCTWKWAESIVKSKSAAAVARVP